MSNPVLEAARAAVKKEEKKLDDLMEAPTSENRELTDAEQAKFEEISKSLKGKRKQVKGLEKEEARADKAAAAAAEHRAAPERLAPGEMVVRSEPGVYRQDASTRHGEPSYLIDLAVASGHRLARVDRADAEARLNQNWKEVQVDARQGANKGLASRIVEEEERWGAHPNELRNVRAESRVNPNTTDGTGGEFVPPLWLVSQYVRFERFGRVCANRVQNMPLPPGIDQINLPKITTGSLTGIQPAQANPVASRDIVTSTVAANVRTIAGQEDISMQLLEQSPIAMDGVVFDDLSRDYDLQLDTQILTGSGSNGQHKGVTQLTTATSNTDITKANQISASSTTFHDTSTSGTQYRSILNGKNQVETLRIAPATGIWVHPRRATSWEYSATDTQARPLFVAYNPHNALGLDNPNIAQGVAGEMTGLPVVKDGNIPTTCNGFSSNVLALTGSTQDVIIVLKEDDLYLWEGTMRMRALPEILSGTLQIRFQVYAYSAFMPDRYPPSISILAGAGTAAPGF